MAVKKAVLIEFNELCPPLLDKWMAAGYLPNFKKLFDSSKVCVSEPDVEERLFLEPWIQWYSLHTGLAYDQHEVFHLGDGPAAGNPDLWSVLKDAGFRVMNFSSMNAPAFGGEGNTFLPDPWCQTERATPEDLNNFSDFVAYSVMEHTNRETGAERELVARFLKFMVAHGLSARTVSQIVWQLLGEKLLSAGTYWKRAAILDRLMFDVFAHYYRRTEPHFATFFSNSVAHYQHAYWRHMDPDAFKSRPSDSEIDSYGGAILFGYRNMDTLIGRFLKLVDQQTLVIFATALSQQPFLRHDDQGGQVFYRVKDVARTFASWDLQAADVQPVMTHQYQVRFEDETARDRGRGLLEAVTLEGEPVFGFGPGSRDSLFVGCQIATPVSDDAQLLFGGRNTAVPFAEVFYRIRETKSAYHCSDGALWLRTGRHEVRAQKASVLDVFPTLLAHFDTPLPEETGHVFRGCSLLREGESELEALGEERRTA